ncbi:MAG TPA: D-alanine--D-alanine ligase family protein, partial [Acidimicrobiales bacterium]|nr:D-alanine--D-alanine ligase family protein [Acidimicrobiales bacterium]
VPQSLAARGPVLDPIATLAPEHPDASLDVAPTVVLPLLHGPLGEDGTVQGLLELTGTAYVGAGVLGSALCMDKAKAKEVLAGAGLPQARYVAWRDGNDRASLSRQVDDELGWPVFVKPANLGSSVGISRVDGPADFDAAVDLGLAYDEWLVVEEAVAGRELECGVLGNIHFEASVPGEIVPSAAFYDFDDKYSGTGAELVVPASLPGDVANRLQWMAVAAASALRAEGMARVDFFYDEAGRGLLVNEANTIPGFTPQSMFPRLWEASGVSYTELLDRLVGLALARHARRSSRLGRSR